jgi:hypothetical protein
MGARKYRSLLSRKYLVIDLEANEMGGSVLLIVFLNEPKPFQIWVYKIDETEFQIRDLSPMNFALAKADINEVNRTQFSRYWFEPK